MLGRLSLALEASAFATLILSWIVGYAVLCPAGPVPHHATHIAQVRP